MSSRSWPLSSSPTWRIDVDRGRRSGGCGRAFSRCLRCMDSWPRWHPPDGTSRSCCWGHASPPCRDMLGSIPPEGDLRRVPEKPLGDAGGSVKGLGAAVEATSHPRSGTARRPAYRKWRVAPGLQGALGTLDGRHGRGDDLGRNGRRVQGRWEGTSERGRCTVVHGASSPDFPSPPVEPDSRVRVRWAAGRTQIYIRR